METLELYLVKWFDSVTRHDISLPFELAVEQEPVLACVVGWLLKKTKKKIVLCSFVFDSNKEGIEPGYKTIHTIPRSVVVEMKKLKVVGS